MPTNKQTALSASTEAQSVPSKLKAFATSLAAPVAVVSTALVSVAAKAADGDQVIAPAYTSFSISTLSFTTMVTSLTVFVVAGVGLRLAYNSGMFVKKATNLAKG